MKLEFCFKCQEPRYETSFSFRNKKTGTRNNTCKVCHTMYLKQHYTAKKVYYNNLSQKWAEENRSRRNAISARSFNLTRTDNVCTCCSQEDFLKFYEQRPKDHHADHIIPLSDGGPHCLKNLQYLHIREHGRKSCFERDSRKHYNRETGRLV